MTTLATLENDATGVEITVCRSDIDGKTVVFIDTSEIDMADNGQPVLRVRMNDARIWEGFSDGSEMYGDDAD